MSAPTHTPEHSPLRLLPPGREGGMAEIIRALAAIVARLEQERAGQERAGQERVEGDESPASLITSLTTSPYSEGRS